MELLFTNETFNDGENITVRRGAKWSHSRGFAQINKILVAEILYSQVFKFFDLTNVDLEKEHDPSCRTYNGLLKEMIRLYPEFDEREIVTVIHFNVLNSVLNAKECDATDDHSSKSAGSQKPPGK